MAICHPSQATSSTLRDNTANQKSLPEQKLQGGTAYFQRLIRFNMIVNRPERIMQPAMGR
jgi:hypothetical protein